VSEGVDWIYLTQNRIYWQTVVNTVMKFRIPWKTMKSLTSLETVSF